MIRDRCLSNACLVLVTTLLAWNGILFADTKPKNFNIGEGPASETLKLAALQGDVEIMISVGAASEEVTNAISGRYFVSEALDRMLANTSLIAVPVSGGSAFGIIARAKEGGEVPTSSENNQEKQANTDQPPKQMKEKKNVILNLLKGFAAAAISSSPSVTTAQSNVDGDEVYELSPFAIDASEDTGYQATSTLAGTRLRTDLRDLGAAISVVTKEFLQDTGATDAGSLLSYTTNTEVGGQHGNFSGAQDQAASRFFQDDERTNPQFNQRIRGLGQAALTRDFFLTEIPFDSYNTDRVTINRGPNSLLFGIGSPGGIISNGLKKPIMAMDFSEVSIRFGQRDSHRVEIDLNKRLVEDRLAVRIAAVHEDNQFKQRPAFERNDRLYLATEAVLFRNEQSDFFDAAVFRANGEVGEVVSTPVEVVPPSRAYDNWFAPFPADTARFTGVTPPPMVLSPSEGGTWEFQHTVNPFLVSGESEMNTNTHPAVFRRIPIFYPQADAQTASLGLSGPDPLGEVSDLSQLQGLEALNNWNASRDTIETTRLAGTPGVADLPTDGVGRYTFWHANSPYGEAFTAGFAVPTLQNRNVFDYRNLLFSGDLDRVKRDFWAQNYSLEQTFLDRTFGIELAFDQQRYQSHQDFLFSGGDGTSSTGSYDIFIDINEFYPNGLPNPNVGRAYMRTARNRLENEQFDRKATRFTAFGEFDFQKKSDGWMRHLGRHRLTGLYNDQTYDQFSEILRDGWDSETEALATIAAATDLSHPRRSLNVGVYVSDPLFGAQTINDVRLNQIRIPRPQPGEEYEILYMDANVDDLDARRIQSGPMQIRRVISGFRQEGQELDRQAIESEAFSLQSSFLNNHLVGLVGWRKDDSESFVNQNETELGVPRVLSDGTLDPNTTILSNQPVFAESGETVTWSVVGRVPTRFMSDLPGAPGLQFHYGESENFNPIGLRNDTLGRTIAQPTGETKEYGFTLNFNNQKFVMKVNWFETNLNKVGAGGVVNVGGLAEELIDRYLITELDGEPFEPNRILVSDSSPSSIMTYQEYYDAMLRAVPPELIPVLNPRFVDTNADGQVDRFDIDPIPNLAATTDRSAEGFEIELVANLTDSWRTLFNVGQQETVQTNTAPINARAAEDFLTGMRREGVAPLLRNPGEQGGVIRSIEEQYTQGAIAGIRSIRAADGTVSNEQREWRFTGVTTYDFKEGKFKGAGVGGAVRWQSKGATGYALRIDDGVVLPDLSQPFFDDGLFSGDLWLSYRKTIFKDIDWKVQLNVRNAFGDNNDIPVRTNPDGQVAVIRIPNPRTWFLTNTFRF